MAKALKFKFESNQPHQKEAIDSVVGMFKASHKKLQAFS